MAKFQSLKAVDLIESRKKDPCKYLWRTVLSIAIDLDHNLVRSKATKTLKDIKENYGNKNMRSLPWQRLYKNGGFERQITKRNKTVQELHVSG